MSVILEEALKLPVAQRIRLADDLYDSVGGSPGSVRLTDQQLEELERRIDDNEKIRVETVHGKKSGMLRWLVR